MRGVGIGAALLAALLLCPALVSAQEEAPAADTEEVSTGDAAAADAEAPEARPEKEEVRIDLNELLASLRATVAAEKQEDQQREAAYRKARQEQEAQALRTEALVRNEESLSQQLEATYASNETLLQELDERLTERIGQMGELFGVVRLVATDLSGEVYTSLTSLGLEERSKSLDKLGRNTGLPSTEDMQKLWFELLREMTAQAEIVEQRVPVIVEWPEATNGGEPPAPVTEERSVVRVGPFTAVTQGEYANWVPDHRTVELLSRQPPPRYVETISGFESGGSGFHRLAVDPSQGALMFALTGTPSLLERIDQGGYVGYTIVALGLIAVLLGLWRMGAITVIGRRVAEQEKTERASDDNPLGRLLLVYERYRDGDSEMLEAKLDDAVLRESSGVQSSLWVVQTISIIAPLLGLLGTVTGMIQTFQAITLFGAGDPKIMAGGISEALVTTTLGLVTAIPLVLLHALLSSRASNVSQVLDERRAALIATNLEGKAAAA